jgi:hypothetical protein
MEDHINKFLFNKQDLIWSAEMAQLLEYVVTTSDTFKKYGCHLKGYRPLHGLLADWIDAVSKIVQA